MQSKVLLILAVAEQLLQAQLRQYLLFELLKAQHDDIGNMYHDSGICFLIVARSQVGHVSRRDRVQCRHW